MKKLAAIDIGGGTQDILIYDPKKTLENCIQLVLPSPTRIVAGKIARATDAGRPVFLYGRVMGGGPSTKAVKDHLAKGFTVAATADAALTIHDDPEKVKRMGVILTEEAPRNAVRIRTGDVDTGLLSTILDGVDEALPSHFAVAVQDHGYSPGESNRVFRFRLWEEFMAQGGRLSGLIYRDVPPYFTRMDAAAKEVPGALLMDTCGAALLGALTDEYVRRKAEEDAVTVVNLGNQHTFCAIVTGERVLALFEHHTGSMTNERLDLFISKLQRGELTDDEVRDDGGHGCVPPATAVGSGLTVVTGPRRSLLQGNNYYFAAPQGNMMLMGCFGLVRAAEVTWEG